MGYTDNIFEFINFSARISDTPYTEGGFAPHIHVRGIHSKRKTIGVFPLPNELIELRVPHGFLLADAKRYVDEHSQEILKKLDKMLNVEYPYKSAPFTYESAVPFFGDYVPIRTLSSDDERDEYIDNNAVYLRSGLAGKEIQESVLRLLGDMSYGIFKRKLDYYANIMGVQYSGLEIDDGRRTFGSYNQDTGVIFLSRRLFMMSESVIDFLIVHELAHAEYFSHSIEHDSVVYRVLPDYDERDKEFYDTCERLIQQGWI